MQTRPSACPTSYFRNSEAVPPLSSAYFPSTRTSLAALLSLVLIGAPLPAPFDEAPFAAPPAAAGMGVPGGGGTRGRAALPALLPGPSLASTPAAPGGRPKALSSRPSRPALGTRSPLVATRLRRRPPRSRGALGPPGPGPRLRQLLTLGQRHGGVFGVDGVEDPLIADLGLGDEADLAADVGRPPAHGAASSVRDSPLLPCRAQTTKRARLGTAAGALLLSLRGRPPADPPAPAPPAQTPSAQPAPAAPQSSQHGGRLHLPSAAPPPSPRPRNGCRERRRSRENCGGGESRGGGRHLGCPRIYLRGSEGRSVPSHWVVGRRDAQCFSIGLWGVRIVGLSLIAFFLGGMCGCWGSPSP